MTGGRLDELIMQAKDSGRYKVANCTQAQPVFYGFAGLPDGKVILVSVLSRCSQPTHTCLRRAGKTHECYSRGNRRPAK